MKLYTFGGAKLEFLHCRLSVDELVHENVLVPAGSDREQVINKTQGWNGDQVLVVVEVLCLLQALLPHGVNLEAGYQRG